MTILDRLNLRPMPVFEAADKAAGGDAADKGGADKDKAAGADKGGFAGALDDGDDGDKGGGGDGGADKGVQQRAPADLPENWRDFIAGDDEALKSELGRVKSPKDLGKRIKDLREKLSRGLDPNEAPPEDEAKLKEWRAARGIPDKATDYKVPEAIKANIRDVDKPIVDGYMEFMHKRNGGMNQAAVDAGLEFYFGMEAAAAEDRAAADKTEKKTTQGTLKEMWGADYKANLQLVDRTAADLVPDVNFWDARLPNGKLLVNVPEFADLLVQLGFQKYGEGAYEGGKGGSDAVGDELGQLKALMNKDIKAWRTNKTGQARYQELLEQKEKRGGR